MFVVTGASATDTALSDCSVVLSKVSFVISKNPSHSDSISMSSVLLELVLVLFLWFLPHIFHLSSGGNFA